MAHAGVLGTLNYAEAAYIHDLKAGLFNYGTYRETVFPNALISYDREALDFPTERISRFALVLLDELGYLVDIIEKPANKQTHKYKDRIGKLRVSMNLFKFDGKMIYPYLKNCPINSKRKEKELPTVLLNFLREHPKTVVGIPFSEHVPDLTTKDDIVTVKKHLEENYKRKDFL
ncbi:MAG: hypothetical protein P8N15_02815 [Flavobacteriaceae bacterium]|nr:hypothetical protein [Flavobacteriaceae bacterium]